MDNFTIISSFARTYSRACHNNLVLISTTDHAITEEEWYDCLCCFPPVVSPSFFFDDERLYNLIFRGGYNMMMSLDLPYELDDGRSVLCLLAKTDMETASSTLSSMRDIYDRIETRVAQYAVSDLFGIFPNLTVSSQDAAYTDTLGRSKVGMAQQIDNCMRSLQYVNVKGKKNTYESLRDVLGETFSIVMFDDMVAKMAQEHSIAAKGALSKLYMKDVEAFIRKTPYYRSVRIHLVRESDWPFYNIALNTQEGARHRPRKFKYAIVFEYVDSYNKVKSSCPLIFDRADHLYYTIVLQALLGRVFPYQIADNYKKFYKTKEELRYSKQPDINAVGRTSDGQYICKEWKFAEPVKRNLEFFKMVDGILFDHPSNYVYDENTLKNKLIPSTGCIYPSVYNAINKQVRSAIASLSIEEKNYIRTDVAKNVDPIHFLFGINNKKSLSIDVKNIVLDLSEEDRKSLKHFVQEI